MLNFLHGCVAINMNYVQKHNRIGSPKLLRLIKKYIIIHKASLKRLAFLI